MGGARDVRAQVVQGWEGASGARAQGERVYKDRRAQGVRGYKDRRAQVV